MKFSSLKILILFSFLILLVGAVSPTVSSFDGINLVPSPGTSVTSYDGINLVPSPGTSVTSYAYTENLTNLSEMYDTNIIAPANLQLLQFQTSDNKWHPYTFSLVNWWDYDYADLINEPTDLSDFADDLGDRGYSNNLNFTNGANYWNDTFYKDTF
jgi:hypothetical protein